MNIPFAGTWNVDLEGRQNKEVRRSLTTVYAFGPTGAPVSSSLRSLQREFKKFTPRVNLRWQDYVQIDPALSRPAEVPRLQGDFGKAERLLGWRPTTTFVELVNMMVDADVQRVRESKCGR